MKNVNGANNLSKFRIFWAQSERFPVPIGDHNETWLHQYDTEQSNNQWSGGIATHPAPKNSECKNPLEKVLAFGGGGDQDGTPLIDYLPNGETIDATPSITQFCW